MVAQQVDDEMSGIHPRIVLFLATAVLHLWSEDTPPENDLDQPPCLILPDAVKPDNYIVKLQEVSSRKGPYAKVSCSKTKTGLESLVTPNLSRSF